MPELGDERFPSTVGVLARLNKAQGKQSENKTKKRERCRPPLQTAQRDRVTKIRKKKKINTELKQTKKNSQPHN